MNTMQPLIHTSMAFVYETGGRFEFTAEKGEAW